MKITAIILVITCLVCCSSSRAEEMATDRPTATVGSSVIRPGNIQVEFGCLYTFHNDVTTNQVPQSLIRIGVINQVELRLGWNGYFSTDLVDSQNGLGDGALGAKVLLVKERHILPEASILASVTIPCGEEGVTSDKTDPMFHLTLSHTLAPTISLAYNLGMKWEASGDTTDRTFAYTIVLSGGVVNSIDAFVECFGDIGMDTSDVVHSIDYGITYRIRDNTQIDILAGTGLSKDADDWFAGIGLSIMFSK